MTILRLALAVASVIGPSLGTLAVFPAQPVESRITSIGLFKNGLAVITRVVQLPAGGVYEIADVPDPVHGTFWVESNAVVQTRVTSRMVAASADTAPTDLQTDLAGRNVIVRLREPGSAPLTGTIVKLKDEDPPRPPIGGYQPYPNYSYGGYGWTNSGVSVPAPRFLILQTETGRTYLDPSMIASVEVTGEAAVPKRRQNVLQFDVQTVDKAIKPPVVTISYLSRGVSWAPSYRIDLSNANALGLQQQAVLKNELEGFSDADVFLISGFPSVEFGHVTSPISPRTNLAAFFSQLSQQGGLRHSSRGDVISQQAVMSNSAVGMPDADLGAQGVGEGVDLHYQPVGKLHMANGDSLMLNVAAASAEYERIIEWLIPDTRNVNGRPMEPYEREQKLDKDDDAPWDAVRFRNPLAFPMTTAPAMIVANGKFNGQRMVAWVNAGEQTTLRITKALSLRTLATEHEEEAGREVVQLSGRRFQRVNVKGELKLNNHRNQEVKTVIRRRFSGELIDAEGSPESSLREDGVYSVNQRNELVWTITLKPGEERTLAYRYTVLVNY